MGAKDYDMSAGFSETYKNQIVRYIYNYFLEFFQQHTSYRQQRCSHARTDKFAISDVREHWESASKLIKSIAYS